MFYSKVASNVRNQDYRGFKKSHRNAKVGYKPMMYFCFDLKLKDGGLGPNLESVALTCPKPAFTSNDVITKCCPPRFTFTNAFYVRNMSEHVAFVQGLNHCASLFHFTV